ncbi:MAG TPA: LysR family transcriptional regulator, partial [Acidobacteriaceae bacterium]
MLPRDLSSLSTFLLVAEERSFTRAAKRQGVSPSAVSHSMRALEEEIGVRLLSRTTRSVAPTEAGERLLSRLKPALEEVGETLGEISGGRDKAAGRIRLLLPRLAVSSVLAPRLGKLSREYPDIILDVTTDDSRRDIVAEGFDAGIHFGEYIQKDMIAVRVSPDQRAAIVGSPAYFDSHPRPKAPRDLLQHRCINFRHGAAGLYRWEFEKGKKSLSVAVSGSLVVDDLELVIRGALEGVGL